MKPVGKKMSLWRSNVNKMMSFVLGLAAMTMPAIPAVAAQPVTTAPSTPPTALESLKLQQTVRAVRETGVAGFAWLTDEIGDNPDLKPGRSIAAFDDAVIDWSKCPTISHSDLAKLLVPNHILEIPSVDGWGNPLEFCLSREDLLRHSYVLGVRSSGRDGKFENKPFKRGTFDPSDLDHDIVWLDGYSVAWPKGLP
jgi:hypothetical protein